MKALKGMFLVLFTVILVGGCYVGSVILGWVMAILTAIGIVVMVVVVLLHETFIYITQSGKKPSRKR